MPVNITNEELDIFNNNGFTDDDVKATVDSYRSQGLDDNAIRAKIDDRLNSWANVSNDTPVIEGKVEQWGMPQYQETLSNDSLTPQQKADEIARIGKKERADIGLQGALDISKNRLGLGLGLGSLALTGNPALSAGLMGLGDSLVEDRSLLGTLGTIGGYAAGGKALDLAAPYIAKGFNKLMQTPIGQKIGKEVSKIGDKILSNPRVQQVTDFLGQEITPSAKNIQDATIEKISNKYLDNDNIYDNFINIHKEKGLIDEIPPYYTGVTEDDVAKYLNVNQSGYANIKTPIEEVKINRERIRHLVTENNPERKLYLNRAIKTLENPNLIVKNGKYNNYLKLFYKNNELRPHLQIVKVAKDGSFYVTNLKPTKSQLVKKIKEGQVVYDLSNVSDISTTNSITDVNSFVNGKSAQRSLQQSVLEAQGTPEEAQAILRNNMPEYTVMSNNELTARAVKDIEQNFEGEYNRLVGQTSFDALDNEKTRQITKRLFDNGEYERAVNLIDRVSEDATKKGQAIQALSLWSNMTPEGAVYKAEKLLKQYNTKTGKQLKLLPEQIDDIRALQTDAMNTTDPYEKSVGFAKTAQYIADLVPKGIGQKLKAYRNLSLLLNPKTLGRNIIGNALFNATDTASKALAVPIDRAIGAFTGNKTRVLPQVAESIQGAVSGARKGFNEALQGIDTRGLGQRFDLQGNRSFNNPIGRVAETALDIGLRVPDRTFYEGAFAESVANQMAAQGLEQPTQDILQRAEQEALEAVFQNNSIISKYALGARNWLNGGKKNDFGFGLGDLAIPYAQTPANLVQQGINYSPLGLVKGVNNLVQGNQRQASLDLARALMGTGIGYGGYELANQGLATPTQFSDNYQNNKNIRNNLQVLGIRPDQIGDYWYAPFQPMSIPLAAGIATQQGENPIQAGLNTIVDLPFLQSLSRGLSDIKDKGIAQAGLNFASSVPSQFVPTGLGQVAQVIDPYQRETYNENILQQGLNQALTKVPYASMTLPEKIDVTGKPIQRYQSNGAERLFDIFLNPTFVNRKVDDVVVNELKNLYDNTDETKQFLPTANKKLTFKDDGIQKTIKLNGKQLSEYQKQLGEKTYEEFDYLMGSEEYQNADAEMRVKMLQDHKSAVKQLVDNEMFGKPISKTYRKKVKNLYINY